VYAFAKYWQCRDKQLLGHAAWPADSLRSLQEFAGVRLVSGNMGLAGRRLYLLHLLRPHGSPGVYKSSARSDNTVLVGVDLPTQATRQPRSLQEFNSFIQRGPSRHGSIYSGHMALPHD
jgi:hypothetical protein